MQERNSPESPLQLDALGASFAFLVLRLWLGARSLLTGLEKFAGTETVQRPLLDEFGEPDISGAMVNVKEKVYGFSHYHGLPEPLYDKFAAEPLMPVWALDLYSGVLGWILLALGVLLLAGALPRLALLASGLVYVSLSVGLVLLNESGGVAWLGTHVLLVALALALVKYNRWAIAGDKL
jgi:thiosulfate dehydrogenase [quinone] large subunit